MCSCHQTLIAGIGALGTMAIGFLVYAAVQALGTRLFHKRLTNVLREKSDGMIVSGLAFLFDPDACKLYKRGDEFDPPRRGGMSVREARMLGLITGGKS